MHFADARPSVLPGCLVFLADSLKLTVEFVYLRAEVFDSLVVGTLPVVSSLQALHDAGLPKPTYGTEIRAQCFRHAALV